MSLLSGLWPRRMGEGLFQPYLRPVRMDMMTEAALEQLTTTEAAKDKDRGAALTEVYKQLAVELKASVADPTTEACLVVIRCADEIPLWQAQAS